MPPTKVAGLSRKEEIYFDGRPTMVAGMETIKNLPMSYYSDQVFASGKHWGTTQNVVEQFHGDCSCWKVTGPWQPLFGFR